jgi:putative hemolysin
MISVDNILEQKFPNANRKRIFYRVFNSCLKHLFHENEFKSFARRFPYLKGFEFVEQVLEEFNMSVQVNSEQVERIPSSGRVVIVANHPLGSLDGLALIREIGQIRRDLKVVATSILNELKPMQSLLIPVDNLNNKVTKSYFKNIDQHLEQDGALLIFPAGEVSRITPLGVRDAQWQAGFLRMAHRAKAPILPIFVDARNSFSFYLASMLYRPLSTLMLVPEMFKRRNSHIKLTIGKLIPYASFEADVLESKAMVKLFAKHVYRLGAGKSELFKTQSSIAHPVDRKLLREAIDECVTLGATEDGKKICLFQGETSSPIMREIGRLREVTFRAVGEGSGNRRDFDNYDTYYHHILLWDDADLEIVGAYRIGLVDQIKAAGLSLYTESLFSYDESMEPYFEFAMELGRSFVQPKYWGKRSLDYLWQGIGAFLHQKPQYRYMIGPVTVPNTLPEPAKRALIFVFNKHFGSEVAYARANRPYRLGDETDLLAMFKGESYEVDLKTLKHYLASMATSIPTLYKQYADLCEPAGLRFIDFGIDPDFGNAVDSLIMLDTYYLKDKKRKRYIG